MGKTIFDGISSGDQNLYGGQNYSWLFDDDKPKKKKKGKKKKGRNYKKKFRRLERMYSAYASNARRDSFSLDYQRLAEKGLDIFGRWVIEKEKNKRYLQSSNAPIYPALPPPPKSLPIEAKFDD